MKIGLDLRSWRQSTGGIGRYSRNLLTELIQLDQQNLYTAIITPSDDQEFTLELPANLQKIVIDIPYYSYREQLRYLNFLNQQQFDLVHFTNFNHPVLYRRPFVVTVHDLIMQLYPSGSQKNSVMRRLAYQWTMRDCKRAKKIIVPSQATKTDLVTKLGFSQEKITVIAEGAEEKFQPSSEQQIAALRQKYHLPEQYVLFVSRWEHYKGLPELIAAYQQLQKELPDLGLVIAGRPDKQNPEVAELVAKAQNQNNQIITPGFIPDEELPIFYSAASTFVHPSFYEGFGIMILEAFASGVPVVTSNNSSLPEIVGDAGLLVDPHQPGEIAEAIKKILIDQKLAESLRQKGYERVKQYSWKKMAEQTLEVYRHAIGDK